MAVRTPLKLNGSNDLQQMSAAEILAIVVEVVRLYGLNPSVTMSVVASGGNLGTLSDTRLIAGAGTTDPTNYDTEAETPDVSTTTVNYSRMNVSYDTSESLWTDATYSYPLYYDGNLREMSSTDFADTFIIPAINGLISGSITSDQAGTYHIATTAGVVSGSTLVSGTPVFVDTRANAAGYTASGIPETQDQPTTITEYYLHRINPASAAGHELPICYTKTGTNLQQMPSATFETALQTMVRYYAAEVAGSKISYNINGTGNTSGTVMTDTKLDGSTYLQRFVDANDYRTQEVPSGTATTISSYSLKKTTI